MMKKFSTACVILMIFLLILTGRVFAQESDYGIHLHRNFGYGGGSNIRGTFTISLVGDAAPVDQVVFLIDGEPMTVVGQAPFSFKFHTDDYGFGMHTLQAEVTLADGSVQKTGTLQYHFVSQEMESKQVLSILGGILGAIIVVMILAALIQSLVLKRSHRGQRSAGQPRQYGLMGGTICPKCGRPFPRHIWGLNLLAGRLDRCEHCGKWVMTTRATPAALAAAEKAEQADDAEMLFSPAASQADVNELEATKYIDEI